ncbi:hypothetical protein BST97_02170 [Nonlabens spongiae]|uniref:DUF3891 domain-containing protein n=1 Tax=Nonlabens spongiae TaxID=331648 RepID=A0A1W6MH47_9FLAO|nr:DUF3891 family protein [Nonlabens spongiae]ARN76900.1 hypothetical protein BST97_02170 [Nonlabens spongiae]
MIVNPTQTGYEIITHYAHGLQAAQIGQHIIQDYRPKYWMETLCAMIEHDDKQLNFEHNNNVAKDGRPLDFTLVENSPEEILERCKRVVLSSRHRSGWVTLMIAQHLEFLYKQQIQNHSATNQFFSEVHELKKKIRKVYAINETQSKEYYELLRFCDRCSLILSMQQIPTEGREIEINQSINGCKYYLSDPGKGINVSPWIFDKDEFEVSTEVYKVEQIKFSDSKDLQQHLLDLSPVIKTWNFRKS